MKVALLNFGLWRSLLSLLTKTSLSLWLLYLSLESLEMEQLDIFYQVSSFYSLLILILNLLTNFYRLVTGRSRLNVIWEMLLGSNLGQKFIKFVEIGLAFLSRWSQGDLREASLLIPHYLFLDFYLGSLETLLHVNRYLLASLLFRTARELDNTWTFISSADVKTRSLFLLLSLLTWKAYHLQFKVKFEIPSPHRVEEGYGFKDMEYRFLKFKILVPIFLSLNTLEQITEVVDLSQIVRWSLLSLLVLVYTNFDEIPVSRLNEAMRLNFASINSRRPGWQSRNFLLRYSLGFSLAGIAMAMPLDFLLRENFWILRPLYSIYSLCFLLEQLWILPFLRQHYDSPGLKMTSKEVEKFYNSITVVND